MRPGAPAPRSPPPARTNSGPGAALLAETTMVSTPATTRAPPPSLAPTAQAQARAHAAL